MSDLVQLAADLEGIMCRKRLRALVVRAVALGGDDAIREIAPEARFEASASNLRHRLSVATKAGDDAAAAGIAKRLAALEARFARSREL